MENENTQPTQAESHAAQNFMIYLTVVLPLAGMGMGFSDMYVANRTSLNLKTIRKIRKELQNRGIVTLDLINYQNNEKIYRIHEIEKAYQFLQEKVNIRLDNVKPVYLITKQATYLWPHKDLTDFYLLKYTRSEEKYRKSHLYPKKLYEDKICPICPQPAATLREYSYKKAHDYDRRCPRCGYYFLFSEGVIRATKHPGRLRKMLKPKIKKYQDSEMILGSRALYRNWRKNSKKKSIQHNGTTISYVRKTFNVTKAIQEI